MKTIFAITAALFATSFPAAAQQHGHINAGIVDLGAPGAGPGDPLAFYSDEIPAFESGGGFAVSMAFSSTGRYAGYYNGNQTFTVLSATSGAPEDALHPASGSFIQLQIVSVVGPQNGLFGFWLAPAESGGAVPSFSIATGTTGANLAQFALSETSAQPDPFGHVHGRRFSATEPGLYTIGFKLEDTSTNGPGGAPIHQPSRVYFIDFNAAPVPEPATVSLLMFAATAFIGSRRRR